MIPFPSQDLVYDLGDASKWEFMFSTMDKPLLMIPSVDETDPLDIDDEEVYINSMTDHLCMLIWVNIDFYTMS